MQNEAKKSILFVLQDMRVGGAEKLRLTIGKYIDKKIYKTSYCCIREVGPVGDEVIKNGGEVTCLDSDDRFFNLFATFKLYRAVTKIHPDIIHSVLFNANFHARIVGALSGIPVITEEQGMYGWKKGYHRVADRILSRFSYRIIAASQGVKDFLVKEDGIKPDKIAVIHNCIDPETLKADTTKYEERKRLGVSDADFVIGAIGNLRKEKGHSFLLEAIKKVKERHKKVKLFIVGDGPLRGHLITMSKELGVDRDVIFLGQKKEVAGFLKALDLFVMPSLSEGLGIALLEALFMSVPCIASSVGGMIEVAEKSSGVVLVEPGNPLKLADAIVDKITISVRGAGNNNNGFPDIFMPRYYVHKLEEIYAKALMDKKP